MGRAAPFVSHPLREFDRDRLILSVGISIKYTTRSTSGICETKPTRKYNRRSAEVTHKQLITALFLFLFLHSKITKHSAKRSQEQKQKSTNKEEQLIETRYYLSRIRKRNAIIFIHGVSLL